MTSKETCYIFNEINPDTLLKLNFIILTFGRCLHVTVDGTKLK